MERTSVGLEDKSNVCEMTKIHHTYIGMSKCGAREIAQLLRAIVNFAEDLVQFLAPTW